MTHAAIDRDFDDHVAAIREFLRIPSVSAGDGDLRPTAAAVRALIERGGGRVIAEESGERRPSLIGVIEGPPPTVMRYGMYDVQPPGSGWTRDPFCAELADGRVYARGAANSKAALAAGLVAAVPSAEPGAAERRKLLEGELPDAADIPSGCQVRDAVDVVHGERVPPVLPRTIGPVVRVEHHMVDPEPAQVVRRRQACLAGPDHHYVVHVHGGATADRHRTCRPPGPAGSAATAVSG